MFSGFNTEDDRVFQTFRIQPDEGLDPNAEFSEFHFTVPTSHSANELFVTTSPDLSSVTTPEFTPVFNNARHPYAMQYLHTPTAALVENAVPSVRLPDPEPPKMATNAIIDAKAGIPLIPISSVGTMTLEEMLLVQQDAGIVQAVAYSEIVVWHTTRHPDGLKALRASEEPHHRGSRGNFHLAPNEDQMFIGQLPMFMTSECLAMTLDFILDRPGAVRRVMLRADHCSGHAPYALVQIRAEVRDLFLTLDRRVYFGRKHAFFTRAPANAPVFQRIVARVLGVDAERPSISRDYQYARSAMVASHAKHSTPKGSRNALDSMVHHIPRGAQGPVPPQHHQTSLPPTPTNMAHPPPPQYQPNVWQPQSQPQPQPQAPVVVLRPYAHPQAPQPQLQHQQQQQQQQLQQQPRYEVMYHQPPSPHNVAPLTVMYGTDTLYLQPQMAPQMAPQPAPYYPVPPQPQAYSAYPPPMHAPHQPNTLHYM